MLGVYGINNLSLKAEDPKMYEMFECPFIAKLGAGFVLVHSIDAHNVKYQINKRLETLSLEDFIKRSSGEILLFENNEECREPNYRFNVLISFVQIVSMAFCIIAGIYTIAHLMCTAGSIEPFMLIALLFSLIGLTASVLLIRKEQKIAGKYVEKFCTMFKKANCDEIISGETGKFLGVFPWSYLGTAFFISNFVCLLLFGQSNKCVLLANVLSILFTLWSIYYQFVKAKKNMSSLSCGLFVMLVHNISTIVQYVQDRLDKRIWN